MAFPAAGPARLLLICFCALAGSFSNNGIHSPGSSRHEGRL
ncbi:hypothetical protein STRDD11_01068 [Streptococcus sp. DD11]|nr:hypothetical protein STRDD11_01068 [Streptococcus sp. DD11]